METKAQFAVKILKEYADENQLPQRSTSDLSKLEEWLLIKMYITNPKNDSTNTPLPTDDIKEEKQLRYFVDIRGGCGAVRDREYKSYDVTYPGLHSDTSDVVEYRHGFIGDNCWNMKQEDINELNELCNKLNNQQDDPRDNPFFEDDSWIHDVDMGAR